MHYDLQNALDRECFKARVKKLYEQGAKVELKEIRQKRTLSQNAIFHLWIALIADHIGEYDRESLKRDIKQLFLGSSEAYNRFTGETIQVEAKTSKLTTEQMSDLLSRVQHWAREELGIYLPSPEEAGFAEMQERYTY